MNVGRLFLFFDIIAKHTVNRSYSISCMILYKIPTPDLWHVHLLLLLNYLQAYTLLLIIGVAWHRWVGSRVLGYKL